MREQRKEIFYESTGVLMEEDEKWHDIRSAVQQDLMRPKSAHYYMHEIDNISEEFIEFIRKTRSTDENIMKNSLPELYRFTLESICYIALDTRLGCMNVPLDPEISKLFEASKAFLSKLFLINDHVHLFTWRIFLPCKHLLGPVHLLNLDFPDLPNHRNKIKLKTNFQK